MPPLSDKELEERLSEAGNSLLQPPSSSDELLPLLDKIEQLLLEVEQSPSQSMQKALSPLLDSLVAELLLKHADIDVKVGVASCISEITRITAPDTPYDDEKMKEVFHLIVSSFEHLSDNSSRSYNKRVSILETVAKVRSCVIMLDLDCDQMIIDMVNHFLNSIRDFHEDAIFESMETIMTLLLDESEDISPDLLIPFLAILRKNNEEAEVLPRAKKLAENVFQKCSEKLKPYVTQTLKVLNASLDDYSGIFAATCGTESGICRHNGLNITEDQKESKDDTAVENTSEGKDSVVGLSQKVVENKSVNENVNPETMTDANDSANPDSNQQFDDLGAQNPATLETKIDRVAKRKGRKGNSKNPSIESTEFQDDNRKSEQEPSLHVISSKDDSISEAIPVEASKTSEHVIVTDTQEITDTQEVTDTPDLHLKAIENEGAGVSSPTERAMVSDENQSKRPGRGRRKKLEKEETRSTDHASKKASDGTDFSDEKMPLSSKTKSGKVTNKNKALVENVSTKNDGVGTSDSEARSIEQTEKVENDCMVVEKSLSKEVNRKKSTRKKPEVKDRSRKDMVNSPGSPVKLAKDAADLVESPRIEENLKVSLSGEKASATTDYNDSLVDSKIRVWWPKDKMFYTGVVTSFDSVTKKHAVLYSDGDQEVLNLKKQRWEFVEDDSASDGGQAIEEENHATSSDMKRKKKGSMYSETSNKRKKIEDSPKSESKSSSKSKNIGGKSGGKTKTDDRADAKSKGNSKSVRKSEDDETGKYKEKPKGKPNEESGEASSKSGDDVGKTSSNSKQNSRQISKSKGRKPLSSKSRSANGTGISKSNSIVAKETVRAKEQDLVKTPETNKGKTADAVKSQENATKSGKKRRR